MRSIEDRLNELANDLQIIQIGGRDIETKERLTEKELAQLGDAMHKNLTHIWTLVLLNKSLSGASYDIS